MLPCMMNHNDAHNFLCLSPWMFQTHLQFYSWQCPQFNIWCFSRVFPIMSSKNFITHAQMYTKMSFWNSFNDIPNGVLKVLNDELRAWSTFVDISLGIWESKSKFPMTLLIYKRGSLMSVRGWQNQVYQQPPTTKHHPSLCTLIACTMAFHSLTSYA